MRVSEIARVFGVFGIVIYCFFRGYGLEGWGKWGSKVRDRK